MVRFHLTLLLPTTDVANVVAMGAGLELIQPSRVLSFHLNGQVVNDGLRVAESTGCSAVSPKRRALSAGGDEGREERLWNEKKDETW